MTEQSDVGSEFVQQTDQPDWSRLDQWTGQQTCSCGGRGITHLHNDRHEPVAPATAGPAETIARLRAEHEQLHHQLADAVGRPISTPWGDLITAAFRAYRAADLLAGAERERQEAEAAITRVRELLASDPSGIFSDDEINTALDWATEPVSNASSPMDGAQRCD